LATALLEIFDYQMLGGTSTMALYDIFDYRVFGGVFTMAVHDISTIG